MWKLQSYRSSCRRCDEYCECEVAIFIPKCLPKQPHACACVWGMHGQVTRLLDWTVRSRTSTGKCKLEGEYTEGKNLFVSVTRMVGKDSRTSILPIVWVCAKRTKKTRAYLIHHFDHWDITIQTSRYVYVAISELRWKKSYFGLRFLFSSMESKAQHHKIALFPPHGQYLFNGPRNSTSISVKWSPLNKYLWHINVRMWSEIHMDDN